MKCVYLLYNRRLPQPNGLHVVCTVGAGVGGSGLGFHFRNLDNELF